MLLYLSDSNDGDGETLFPLVTDPLRNDTATAVPPDVCLRAMCVPFRLAQEKKNQAIGLIEKPVFWSVIGGHKSKGVGWSDEEGDKDEAGGTAGGVYRS